jgi:hypothetical protein
MLGMLRLVCDVWSTYGRKRFLDDAVIDGSPPLMSGWALSKQKRASKGGCLAVASSSCIMHHASIIIVPSHRSRDRSHSQISSQPKDSSVVRVKMGYSSYYFYGLGVSWISIFIIVGLYLLFTGKSLPPLDRDRTQ